MKSSEFKKVDEAFFSQLTGLIPNATVSRKVNPKNVQKLYLEDFIEDLMVDMESAITGGAINFDIGSLPPEQKPSPRQAAQPTTQTRKDALIRAKQRKQKNISNVDDKDNVSGYNEGYYSFLDSLVEGYIVEQKSESMASWVMRWFDAYMKGVNWTNEKNEVQQLANEIQKTYANSKGRKAIEKLAELSWNIVFAQKGIPKGAEDVYQPQQNHGTSSGIPKSELEVLEKLRKKNPQEYTKVLKVASGQTKI